MNDAERGRQPKAIVLFGVSGSGKTTIGTLLAPLLDATFIEGDDYHSLANVAKMRSGTPLTDADRKPWLEKLGHAIGAQCHDGRSVVAACSALRRAYRDALASAAGQPLIFIHLTIPMAVVDSRLKERTQHFMPPSLLRSQLDTLEPLQRDEDGTVIAEADTAPKTAAAIHQWMNRRAGA